MEAGKWTRRPAKDPAGLDQGVQSFVRTEWVPLSLKELAGVILVQFNTHFLNTMMCQSLGRLWTLRDKKESISAPQGFIQMSI